MVVIKKYISSKVLLSITSLLPILAGFSSVANAITPVNATNEQITYSGRILKPDLTPLESNDVWFRIQIYSTSTSCLLYEETQELDMTGAKGVFSLKLNNKAVPAGNVITATEVSVLAAASLKDIFSNSASLTCASGSTYNPSSIDTRKIIISFKDVNSNMTSFESFASQEVSYVPIALKAIDAQTAQKIGTYGSTNLLRVPTSTTASELTSTQYTEFLALLGGTSTQFVKSADAGKLSSASVPSFAAGDTGKSIRWTGTTWEKYDPSTAATSGMSSISSTTGDIVVSTSLPASSSSPSLTLNSSSTGGASKNDKILKLNASGLVDSTALDLNVADLKKFSAITGTGGIAASGFVYKDTSSGDFKSYNFTGALALNGATNAIQLNYSTGLTLSTNNLVVDFAATSADVTAGKAIQASDARLPSSTCASGNLSRWTGTAWTCDALPAASSSFSSAVTVTSNDTNALAVGANGSTNPALSVNASISGTGVKVTSAAAGSGATIQAISSVANEDLSIKSAGSGNLLLDSGTSGNTKFNQNGTTRATFNDFYFAFNPGASNTAATPRFSFTGSADSALATTVEANNVFFDLGQVRTHTTGAITTQRDFRIKPSTHAFAGASTVTNAATLSVDGPSIGGTSATLTNSSAIYVPTSTLSSTVTNSYGLNVAATTGATNNYAAAFTGGNVGIGTAAPAATLDVQGAIISTGAPANSSTGATTATVDFSTGNIQYSSTSCGAFSLKNMKAGGSYSLVVQGATAATCAFTMYSDNAVTTYAAGNIHMPSDHGATTASKHTVYTFIVIGGHVYVSWISGI